MYRTGIGRRWNDGGPATSSCAVTWRQSSGGEVNGVLSPESLPSVAGRVYYSAHRTRTPCSGSRTHSTASEGSLNPSSTPVSVTSCVAM